MLKLILKTGLAAFMLCPTLTYAQSANVDDIIESYITDGAYTSVTAPCTTRALRNSNQSLSQYSRKKTNGIAAQVNRGDSYTMVGGKISQTLNAVSFCYKEDNRPLSDQVNIASDLARLLIYRLQGKSDFGVNSQDLTNARALTAFAKSSGIDMGFEVNALKQFRAPKEVSASESVSKIDLNQVAIDAKSNSLRVKRKYDNKQVSGFGKIYTVRFIEAHPVFGGEDNLFVDFDGPKTFIGSGSSGELEETNFISCKVELGSASEEKAIDLNKGDTVNVSGTFRMDSATFRGMIIENCIIF